MRTTLSLDDDVAVRLKAETRRTGKSFKETVNDYLRLGLNTTQKAPRHKPFRIRARDLGRLRPGLSLDSTSDLLEQLEGPLSR